MSYSKIGDSIGSAMVVMFVTLCISVPLGLWKLAEIVIWFFGHIKWVSLVLLLCGLLSVSAADTTPPVIEDFCIRQSTLQDFSSNVPFTWTLFDGERTTNSSGVVSPGFIGRDPVTGQWTKRFIKVTYLAESNECYSVWYSTYGFEWLEYLGLTTCPARETMSNTVVLPILSTSQRFYWIRKFTN
jgi:hypothetical protein